MRSSSARVLAEIPRWLVLTALAAACANTGCALVPAADHSPERVELAASRVEIPLIRSGRGHLVEARLDGSDPRRLLVDTGASLVLIAPDAAGELEVGGIPLPRTVNGPMGSEWRWVPSGEFDAVDLVGGRARLEGLGFWVLAFPSEADGLVGLPAFSGCLVTLDLPGLRLVLERGELPEPDGDHVLPYRLEGGVPVIVVSIAETAFEVVVDSGYAGALSLSPELAERVSWVDEPAGELISESVHGTSRSEWRRPDGSLTVGGYDIANVPVQIDEGAPLLGDAILRRFVITFDLANRRVRLIRPTGPPQPGDP